MIGAPLLLTFCAVIAAQFGTQRELLIDGLRRETLSEVLAASLRADGEFLCVTQAVDSRVAVLGWMSDQLVPLDAPESRARIMRLLRDDLDTDSFIFGAALAFAPGTPATAPAGYAPYVCRTLRPRDATGVDSVSAASAPLREFDLAAKYDYAIEPWFRDAASHPAGFWTEPYFDDGGGDALMVTYSMSVPSRMGLPSAVATADVSLRDIRTWIRGLKQKGSDAFAIVSTGNRFISFPKSAAFMQGVGDVAVGSFEHSVLTAAEAFRLGGPAFVRTGNSSEFAFDGTRMVFVTMPTTGWVFVGFFPESSVLPAVIHALLLGPGIVLLGALAALVIVWFGANAIVQPLRAVTAALARLATGDLSARAPATARSDEIGVLSRSFNRMGDALQSAIAERENATQKRLAVEAQVGAARAIQRLLLPACSSEQQDENLRTTTEFQGLALSGYSEPAGEIAGDFFDWFTRGDGTVVVMIADVCGKGMAAAMMMAVSRTLVRTAAMEASQPSAAFAAINRDLLAQAPATKFTTGILLYIDGGTGAIQYANAGHPLPLLIAGDGGVREVMDATGTVLGIQPDEVWTTGSLTMQRGESLVLFTDGVTEAMAKGGDPTMMFGTSRAIEAVTAASRTAARTPHCAAAVLVAAVEAFRCGNRNDDLTVVSIERA